MSQLYFLADRILSTMITNIIICVKSHWQILLYVLLYNCQEEILNEKLFINKILSVVMGGTPLPLGDG